jgi:hypothetical protein
VSNGHIICHSARNIAESILLENILFLALMMKEESLNILKLSEWVF